MKGYRDVVALENQALVARTEGRYDESIAAHTRALAIARNLNRPRLTAVICNRLGRAMEADGNVQQAVSAYETGFKALGADPSLDIDDAILSLVPKEYAVDLARLPVPDLYSAETASDLETAKADPSLAVKLLINIGNAYLRQPQYGPALNAFEQALGRPELAQAPDLRAHALTHIGLIRRRQGETDTAESLLKEALTLLKAHADPLEQRRVLAALAGIYRDRGQYERAIETYQRALELYARASDPLGEGRTQAGLGHLYLERGRYSEALGAFQRALNLATEVDDADTLWHANWGLGRCHYDAGELDAAAMAFRRSLDLVGTRQRELRTDEGKVTFIDSVQDIYDQLITVHLEQARTEPSQYRTALDVAEEARGQAFSDLMVSRKRQRLSHGSGIRPSRQRSFDDRWGLMRQMAPGIAVDTPFDSNMAVQAAPSVDLRPPPDLGGLLSEAARVIHDRQDETWPESVEAAGAAPSSTAGVLDGDGEKKVPEPPPVAHLVFHVLTDRTAVFAVTPEGDVHGHVAALGRAAIADRVAGVRRALQVDERPRGMRLTRDARRSAQPEAPTDPKPLLRELYTQLIAPVAEALPSDSTPVVIEPHAALWLLPFAALVGPDDTWLADRCPLLYAPSTRAFDQIRRDADYGGPTDLKGLVVGNPTMPPVPDQEGLKIVLQPLPGAEREARAVADLLHETGPTLLLGAHADRKTVEKLMQTHGIIHLATHGVAYAEDPNASFIALAETPDGSGLLTARDVTSLWLPADLVALSACQTGLGKVSGDGMIGLSRVFLAAGARAVLVSQWSVSDEATAALMAAFYRGYIELDDKAIALQQAMRALRSVPEYAHPRYWAPFVVVGAEA